MDIITGISAAQNAVDLVGNEKVSSKTANAMGLLFPFAGISLQAVDIYIDDIKKSKMTPEEKVFMILNIKKTFKKIKNQKDIAELAMMNVKPGTDFTDKSGVREAWLDRFMDSAGYVDSDEIKLIWGKILANEFEKPSSTPPTMIRILSEITPELASAFRYICSMSFSLLLVDENECVYDKSDILMVPYDGNEETFRKEGADFVILNELESLGIIRFDSFAGYVTKGITVENAFIFVEDKLEKLDKLEKIKKNGLPIGNVILTSAGEALKNIIDLVKVENYYNLVREYMVKNGVSFSSNHKYVVEKKEGNIRVRKE